VSTNYLADETQAETVDRFFEAYLLWLFGFMLFCSSQGDVVVRYLILHTKRIADGPLDVVPQISWGNTVLFCTYRGLCLGVLKGRSEQMILLGCPLLLQLWCHEWLMIGRSVVSLHLYEALPEGHDPIDHFTIGLIVVSADSNFLPFTFNLSLHFVYFGKSTFRVHISFVCRPRMLTSR
jgi:hypothetical protein